MKDLLKAFSKGLKPTPTLTHADWAQKYYILPPGAATPGLINMTLTPYLVEPLINFSWSSPIREECWMKGIQIAATTLYDIVCCGVVDFCPCPMIFYFGSDSMAIEYSKIRLESYFEHNPKLVGKVSDGYDKKGKSTHGLKIFQGGSIKLVGGISEKVYRSYSAAIVLLDDIDAFPRDIGGTEKRKGQGSPIDLAKTRTNARQGKYKIGVSGSPTDTETSLIYEEFQKTDQRYYYVPCPFCGTLQVIDFWRIKFKKNAQDELITKPELECISCNKLIPENKKYEIMQLKNGAKWIATKETNNPLVAGRHLSSAYSLIGYDWSDMAKEFIIASRQQKRGNSRPLRTFYNTKLGIPWDNYREQNVINHSDLHKRREEWRSVPEAGVIITAGVDIQAQRIEILVAAHGQKADVYCLEHKVIGGNTLIAYGLDGSPFNELEEYLCKTFINSWGRKQPIMHTCIDMGFRSIIVSPFLFQMTKNGVEITGIFGSSSKTKKKSFVGDPITNKYGVLQRELNVDEGKTLNHFRLQDGLIHFNKHPSFTEEFFRQLTIERFDEKEQRWTCADHARNEATDMLNYLTAAFEIYSNGGNIDWEDFKAWNKNGCQLLDSSTFQIISDGVAV
jgi:phage terminase large subunit GpA-like protein